MFSHLDRIPACLRQTDGQTDILPQHRPSSRYAYASRGNKNNLAYTEKKLVILC